MGYRSNKRRGKRYGGYGSKKRNSFKRTKKYSSSGGSRTLRIVVEQAAPQTGSVIPAANAAVQMASKRSMF